MLNVYSKTFGFFAEHAKYYEAQFNYLKSRETVTYDDEEK